MSNKITLFDLINDYMLKPQAKMGEKISSIPPDLHSQRTKSKKSHLYLFPILFCLPQYGSFHPNTIHSPNSSFNSTFNCRREKICPKTIDHYLRSFKMCQKSLMLNLENIPLHILNPINIVWAHISFKINNIIVLMGGLWGLDKTTILVTMLTG